jgi:hypothetical protein
VLAALDGADERLAAPDPLGHLLLTELSPLTPFLDQATQYIVPG